MNRQNHSEPENRLTLEEHQEFLELLARLSPEQREACLLYTSDAADD